MLEEPQLHAEHLVVLLDDLSTWFQLAHGLGAVHLHCIERGGDGAVVAHIGGVDMPAVVDRGAEYDFSLLAAEHFQLRGEVYRVHYLATCRQPDEGGKHDKQEFVLHLFLAFC